MNNKKGKFSAATNKSGFSVTFMDDSFSKVQQCQKENSIGTQSNAVVQLVELAICEIESENSPKSPFSSTETALVQLSPSEQAHIKKYRRLDGYGKDVVDNVLDLEHK